MKFFTNMKMTAKLVLLLGVMLAGFAVIGSTYLNLLQAEKKTVATTQKLGRFHLEIEKNRAAARRNGDPSTRFST